MLVMFAYNYWISLRRDAPYLAIPARNPIEPQGGAFLFVAEGPLESTFTRISGVHRPSIGRSSTREVKNSASAERTFV